MEIENKQRGESKRDIVRVMKARFFFKEFREFVNG